MKKFMLIICVGAFYATQGQTVKKIIVEDYTGAWCGWCPEGTIILEQMSKQYPTNMIALANHCKDSLEINAGKAVSTTLEINSWPCGSIDRYKFSDEATIGMNREKWLIQFTKRKSVPAIASVAFANNKYEAASKTYEADINVKFNTAPTPGVPLVVNVYILEDSIPAKGGLVQQNYSTTVQKGAKELKNWYHNHTLRMSLGDNWGFDQAIPDTPVVNTTYKQHISFSLPDGYVKKNIHLVAYVAYNGEAKENGKEIINAEEMRLLSTTGIEDKQKTIVVRGVYPNPAFNNDIIKIEYNIERTSLVSINIYNIFGQMIAQPYYSHDVAGTHTAQWKPSEYNVSAGSYILQLTTKYGSQSTRIVIH